MAETRVYKRRHPERTDYYRIIESRFEELERMWPECFEQKYGCLRKEVVRAIYAFLDCGIRGHYFLDATCVGTGSRPGASTAGRRARPPGAWSIRLFSRRSSIGPWLSMKSWPKEVADGTTDQ
jgi:hypothetical protein